MSMDVRGEVVRIVALLEALGYQAHQSEHNRIRVNSGGIFATIMLYADGSLSLRCRVLGNAEFILDLEKVNRANHEMRFGKFSIDDGAILLESDFVFDPTVPEPSEALGKIMAIWDAALGRLKSLVLSLEPA